MIYYKKNDNEVIRLCCDFNTGSENNKSVDNVIQDYYFIQNIDAFSEDDLTPKNVENVSDLYN